MKRLVKKIKGNQKEEAEREAELELIAHGKGGTYTKTGSSLSPAKFKKRYGVKKPKLKTAAATKKATKRIITRKRGKK